MSFCFNYIKYVEITSQKTKKGEFFFFVALICSKKMMFNDTVSMSMVVHQTRQ